MLENRELVSYIRIGLQDRPPKYGKGDTRRVIEIPFGDYNFGINLGDVAQAPTDAVMCPTTPWLEIGGGAVENRLTTVMGEGAFEKYAKTLQYYLVHVIEAQGVQRAFAAHELADYSKKVPDYK